MLQAVILWQVYAISGSTLSLGIVGLVGFVSTLLSSLIGGVVVDAYDRRMVLFTSQTVPGLGSLGMLAAIATDHVSLALIYGVVLVTGLASSFESPARQAILPAIVPRRLYTRAMTTNSALSSVTSVSGPALGGVLYGLGPTAVYATVAALYLLAAALVGLVHAVQPAHEPEEMTPASLFSGMTFILRERLLLGLLSLDLFAVLLGGATALLPIYARDILDTGPWGLGLLRAAPACGALAMSVALTRRPVERHAGPVLFGGVLVFGVATVVFGASTRLPLSLAALTVLGASDLLSVVIRHSLVQIRTPDSMRGRVSAAHSLTTGTSNQLGEFESGLLAALFGPVAAVLIGGIGTIVVAAVWMRRFPELRRFHLV